MNNIFIAYQDPSHDAMEQLWQLNSSMVADVAELFIGPYARARARHRAGPCPISTMFCNIVRSRASLRAANQLVGRCFGFILFCINYNAIYITFHGCLLLSCVGGAADAIDCHRNDTRNFR